MVSVDTLWDKHSFNLQKKLLNALENFSLIFAILPFSHAYYFIKQSSNLLNPVPQNRLNMISGQPNLYLFCLKCAWNTKILKMARKYSFLLYCNFLNGVYDGQDCTLLALFSEGGFLIIVPKKDDFRSKWAKIGLIFDFSSKNSAHLYLIQVFVKCIQNASTL